MMNTASLELSKALYELSGWNETFLKWYEFVGYDFNLYSEPLLSNKSNNYRQKEGTYICPACDLGYLLRKLPKSVTKFWGSAYPASPLLVYSGSSWIAYYHSEMTGEHNNDDALIQFAGTAEDAACLVAIELFRQGILKRE